VAFESIKAQENKISGVNFFECIGDT